MSLFTSQTTRARNAGQAHGSRLPRRGARRRSAAGFTMVEIALSLAIIGFALVAIIGVLPLGLSVQRENREEAIIQQDANVFLDAIRSGARGLDELTNAVLAITNFWTYYEITPTGTNVGPSDADGYDRFGSITTSRPTPPNAMRLTNGFRIVGLLGTPKYRFTTAPPGFFSNYVVAYVRAMSGLAAEKFPQDNPDVQTDAFKYRMISENVELPVPPNLDPQATNPPERQLSYNLREVRLLFRWPLFASGQTGNSRRVFRTLVAGPLTNDPPGGVTWFFQQHQFAKTP